MLINILENDLNSNKCLHIIILCVGLGTLLQASVGYQNDMLDWVMCSVQL